MPQDTPSRVTTVPARGGPLEISSWAFVISLPTKCPSSFFEAFIPGSALPFPDPFLQRVVETEVLLRPSSAPTAGPSLPGSRRVRRTGAFLSTLGSCTSPSTLPLVSTPAPAPGCGNCCLDPDLSFPLTLTLGAAVSPSSNTTCRQRLLKPVIQPLLPELLSHAFFLSAGSFHQMNLLISSSCAGNLNSHLSSISLFPVPHTGDKPSCRPARPLDLPPQGVFSPSPERVLCWASLLTGLCPCCIV